MNRRTLAASLAAATLLSTASGALALRPGGAEASTSSTRVRYVAHDVAGQLAMADLADPKDGQPGIGDELAFTQRLTRRGRTIGRVSNVAFGVDARRDLFQANGTMVLPHGKITFAGLVSQRPHFSLAVTGGTGAYRGATGKVAFDFDHGRQVLTLVLRH